MGINYTFCEILLHIACILNTHLLCWRTLVNIQLQERIWEPVCALRSQAAAHAIHHDEDEGLVARPILLRFEEAHQAWLKDDVSEDLRVVSQVHWRWKFIPFFLARWRRCKCWHNVQVAGWYSRGAEGETKAKSETKWPNENNLGSQGGNRGRLGGINP